MKKSILVILLVLLAFSFWSVLAIAKDKVTQKPTQVQQTEQNVAPEAFPKVNLPQAQPVRPTKEDFKREVLDRKSWTPETVNNQQVQPLPAANQEAAEKEAMPTLCTVGNALAGGYYHSAAGGNPYFYCWGEELWATFINPEDSLFGNPRCAQPIYPFMAKQVMFAIYSLTDTAHVLFQPEIRDVVYDPSGCAYPGAALLTGPVYNLALGAGGVSSVYLSLVDSVCLYKPWFAVMHFLNSDDFFDTTYCAPINTSSWFSELFDNSGRTCVSYWNPYGPGGSWYDVTDYAISSGAIRIRTRGYSRTENTCLPPAETWYFKDSLASTPCGVPDFDQYQMPGPAFCGPTAEANSYWWLNAKWGFDVLGTPPALISEIAAAAGTNPTTGTNCDQLEAAILQVIYAHGGWWFTETTVYKPDFWDLQKELKQCHDITLLLGFWQFDGANWYRFGGHFVTMAGVDIYNFKFAISDPALDKAEAMGGNPVFGKVCHTDPWPHVGSPLVHNNPANTSHDYYDVAWPSSSPGGYLWLPGYCPGKPDTTIIPGYITCDTTIDRSVDSLGAPGTNAEAFVTDTLPPIGTLNITYEYEPTLDTFPDTPWYYDNNGSGMIDSSDFAKIHWLNPIDTSEWVQIIKRHVIKVEGIVDNGDGIWSPSDSVYKHFMPLFDPLRPYTWRYHVERVGEFFLDTTRFYMVEQTYDPHTIITCDTIPPDTIITWKCTHGWRDFNGQNAGPFPNTGTYDSLLPVIVEVEQAIKVWPGDPYQYCDLVGGNNIATITNYGRLGPETGHDFKWPTQTDTTNQLFDGSLCLGTDATDMAVSVTSGKGYKPIDPCSVTEETLYVDGSNLLLAQVGRSKYSSIGIPDIHVTQTTYDFTWTGDLADPINSAVLHEFKVENVGASPILGISQGVFHDFDVNRHGGYNLGGGDSTVNTIWQDDTAGAVLVTLVPETPGLISPNGTLGEQNSYLYNVVPGPYDSLYALMNVPNWDLPNTAPPTFDWGVLLVQPKYDLAPGTPQLNSYFMWGYEGLPDDSAVGNTKMKKDARHKLFYMLKWKGFYRGDVSCDGKLDVADVIYMINYLFKGGPKLKPMVNQGDVNNDGSTNVGDVIYIINYLFKGGPAPLDKDRWIVGAVARPGLFGDPQWKTLGQ